jgi:hypothetical protein
MIKNMESAPKQKNNTEQVIQNRIHDLLDSISFRQDAELAYCLFMAFGQDLGPVSKAKIVKTIGSDHTTRGDEFAFKMLRDVPALESEYRDILFKRIITSADKTTCNQTLLLVPNLGIWEMKLRNALSK